MAMRKTSLDSAKGVIIALSIIVSWATTLILLLRLDLARFPLAGVLPVLLLQTFLYTGLFITAHDAMHGSVAPRHKRLNNFIGMLCVLLYALFSFKRLRSEHRKHHAQPASGDDPDFHDGNHPGFWAWYLHFMFTYVTWQQVLGMAIVFNVLAHVVKIPPLNLALFWVMPALLSTLQLFYFGTYLPHREPAGGYSNRHRARSNDFSVLASFLSCYHFGYHWEHHEYPYTPWWKLPAVRRQTSQLW